MENKETCAEILTKPISLTSDRLEYIGFAQGRVSILRDLFQRGKPIPIEDLGSKESQNNVAIQSTKLVTIPLDDTCEQDQTIPRVSPLSSHRIPTITHIPSTHNGYSENQVPQCFSSDSKMSSSKRCIDISSPSSTDGNTSKEPLQVDLFATTSDMSIPESNGHSNFDEIFLECCGYQKFTYDTHLHQKLPPLQMLHAEDVAILTPESESTPDELAFDSSKKATDLENDTRVEVDICDTVDSAPTLTTDSTTCDENWRQIDDEEIEETRCEFALPSHLQPVAVNSSGIHLLEDGHFFYKGSGLPPLSVPDSIDGSISNSKIDDVLLLSSPECQKERDTPPMFRSVRFSTKPITIFSTHSVDDYKRRNDSVDPIASSAEYELEKRLEVLDLFEITLHKGASGLGISILGMGMESADGVEKLGIFIKAITPGGAADTDGRMRVYDQLVEVDGKCLVGVSQNFAAAVLRNTAGSVSFVVGREKSETTNSISSLLQGDEMTASTSSSTCTADTTDEPASDKLDTPNNDDSAGTLRKLLADASATAAKAHAEDMESDDIGEASFDGEDMDINDEDFLDNDEATTDTLTNDSEQLDHVVTNRRSRNKANNNIFLAHEASSDDIFEFESADQQDMVLDINKEMSKMRQRDVIISRIVNEAVIRATSKSNDLYEIPESVNVHKNDSEGEKSNQLSKKALSALRILATDLYNIQLNSKKLRARLRHLGQRLTDQEAAADEAIERLCLRCHNLEIRLSEKQTKSTSINHDKSERQINYEYSILRCNPSLSEERVTSKLADVASDIALLSDGRMPYDTLFAIYEAALEREGSLKAELSRINDEHQRMIESHSSELSALRDQITDTTIEKSELSKATITYNCGEINSTPHSEHFEQPVDQVSIPSLESRITFASINHIHHLTDLDDLHSSNSSHISPLLSPPPRPPRPPRPHPDSFHNSIPRLTHPEEINVSQLQDEEGRFLPALPPFNFHPPKLDDFYLQRIHIGASGSFSRKRPPSRKTRSFSSPTDEVVYQPPISLTPSCSLGESISATNAEYSVHSKFTKSSHNSPPLPRIPLSGLQDAIKGLKPLRSRFSSDIGLPPLPHSSVQLTNFSSVPNSESLISSNYSILHTKIPHSVTANSLGSTSDADPPRSIEPSSSEFQVESPNVPTCVDSVDAYLSNVANCDSPSPVIQTKSYPKTWPVKANSAELFSSLQLKEFPVVPDLSFKRHHFARLVANAKPSVPSSTSSHTFAPIPQLSFCRSVSTESPMDSMLPANGCFDFDSPLSSSDMWPF